MRIFSPSRLIALCFLFFLLIGDAYAQGEFLYLNRDYIDHNAVSVLSIAADGSLTEISGSPFPTGGRGWRGQGRQSIVIHGTFLFVANGCSSDISVFTINPLTGSLTLVPESLISTSGSRNCVYGGVSLGITPDGRFLMAGNTGDGTVAVFSVGPTGLLTPVQGSPFPILGFASNMKVTPDNKFLIIATANLGNVEVFGGVEVYSISSAGALTAVPGSPFLLDGLRSPVAVDIRCDGKIFVEGGYGNAKVLDVLNISSTGQLSQNPGSPYLRLSDTGVSLGCLSYDEKFLFANHIDFTPVQIFSVAPDGQLTFVPGGGANLITDYLLSVATNRSSTMAYFGVFGGNVIIPAHMDSSGKLTPGQNFPVKTSEAGGVPALAVFPAKTCGPQFGLCIQDDSNGNILQLNPTTGVYQFSNCAGLSVGGTGTLTKRGGTITLQHNAADRRVLVTVDTSTKRATASVQLLSQGRMFTITDRNITNNTCACK